MGLGSKWTIHPERAPWTEFKNDPEKAKETLLSPPLMFCTRNFLSPYLPQLSKSILSYFGLTSESEVVKKIYQGDLKALKEFFAQDFKLQVDPQGLVPKIDPKVIEELDLKLKEKAAT